MRLLLALAITLGLPLSANANSNGTGQSVITINLQAPLSGLNDWLEANLPRTLHERAPRREVCVPAKRACTKIPEFRGFKIYSRMECIDVSPRITCDISERAVREGPFRLTGSGGTLTAQQVIAASVRARGRGEIGKNITQTARGALLLTLGTTPRIESDWTLKSNATIDYQWTRRPALKLFNLIDVTIAGEVEGELNAQIARLENGGADAALARLDIRRRMQTLWSKAREPVEIDLGLGTAPLFLHLQPHSIAASDLSFANDTASISLQMAGRAKATPSRTPPWSTRSELPDLGQIPSSAEGFALHLPIMLDWPFLNAAFAQALPHSFPVTSPASGTLTLSAARLYSGDGQMLIDLEVAFAPSSALLPDVSGSATLQVSPDYDAERRVLEFRNVALRESTPRALTSIIALAQTLNQLERDFALPLSKEIEDLEKDLRQALISSVIKGVPGLTRSGELAIGFRDLKIMSEGLALTAEATGRLTVTMELVP